MRALGAARAPAARAPALVLIDGTSGSGKTSLADALTRRLGSAHATVLHLDDIYPGWSGLDVARSTVARLAPAYLAGGAPTWRRYDWNADHLVATHPIDPAQPLVIEGCGAFAVRGLPWPAVRVWLDAPEPIRRDRALARDPAFAAYWTYWESAVRRYIVEVHPERWADIALT